MRGRAIALAWLAVARCGHTGLAPDASIAREATRPPWRAASALAQPASPARAVGGEDEHGGWRVVLGGRRAEVHGRSVRWGDGAFSSAIVAAHHARAGWIFVAQDGAVARARTFAGALEPLGALGPERSVAPTSQGAAALVLDGQLFTSDGSAHLALAASAVQGHRFVAASFADERLGAALLEDGSLAATADGGRSFRRVVLPRGAARELVMYEGRVRVELRAGGWRSLEGDALVATEPRGVDPFAAPVVVPEVVQRVLLASLLEREGALVASSDVEALESAGSGHRWSVVARDRDRVALSDGARTVLAGAAPGGPDDACVPFALRGDARIERCAGAIERRSAAGPTSRVAVHGDQPRTPLVSDDGLRVAWPGRCDGRDDAVFACLATFASPPPVLREIRFPAELVELVAARGDALLARVRVAGRAQPCVVDLASGAARVRPWPRPAGAPADAQADRVGWSDDGRLYGFAAGSGYAFAEQPGDGALRTIALPAGAVAIAFGDAQHGVAAGDSLGEVFVTRDAGRTFDRVAPPRGVDPLALRLGDPLHRSDVACDAAGCTVGGALHLDGFGTSLGDVAPIVRREAAPAIGPATRVTGAAAAPAARPACTPERDAPGPNAFGPVRFECTRR